VNVNKKGLKISVNPLFLLHLWDFSNIGVKFRIMPYKTMR